MGVKKNPLFRDMVRMASSIRSEKGDILKDASGKKTAFVDEKFKEFSFLTEGSVKRTLDNYLNNIDRGI